MTVSAGMKTFKNLKLENSRSINFAQYVYHFNTFLLLKTESINQKATEGTSKTPFPGALKKLGVDFLRVN